MAYIFADRFTSDPSVDIPISLLSDAIIGMEESKIDLS